MTTYFKILLLMTVVTGLSVSGDARADFRDYNYKAWAQAGRSSSRSMRASRTYRAYRAPGPVIVRSDSAPDVVAQAPMGQRSYSYEPAETARKVGASDGCGAVVRTERTSETAQRSTGTERSFSYEPSIDSSTTQPSVRSESAPMMRSSQPSRSSGTPRYLLPKTDPRKYRN